MGKHACKVYSTLEDLLEVHAFPLGDKRTDSSIRFWVKRWKSHIEKNGNVPFLIQCAVCSGQERKHDRKVGKWKAGKIREGSSEE